MKVIPMAAIEEVLEKNRPDDSASNNVSQAVWRLAVTCTLLDLVLKAVDIPMPNDRWGNW